MLKLDLIDVEANLEEKAVPPLNILRQGIVVLSRQWKNALYTPILIEYNLRSKGFKNLYNTNLDSVLEGMVNDENEEDDEENDEDDENEQEAEFDEEALLLKKASSAFRFPFRNAEGSIISDLSARFGPKLSPGHFSPLSGEDLLLVDKAGHGSMESLDSYDPINSVSEHVTSASKVEEPEEEETLYNWMKRQQINDSKQRAAAAEDAVKVDLEDRDHDNDDDEEIVTIQINANDHHPSIKENDLDLNNLELGGEHDMTPPTPQTKQMHLLDAHIIFEPLLSSLGLMPQQIQNLSLKNLGSNVSVLANIETFKIDIVESEFGKMQRSQRSKKSRSRMFVDTDTSPAFLCEKIYMQVDFKKVTDISMDDKEKVPIYISRAQLKRHTSSLVNFSIDIFFISQKVNMPLLRLLNQIATMHQNVKETNEELKENKPIAVLGVGGGGGGSIGNSSTEGSKTNVRKHKRSSSGDSSTSSNLSRQAETPNFITDTPTSRKATTTTTQTPSPSVTFKSTLRNRPKSFAQKFRPNSRLAGYSSMESPVHDQVQDSFILTSAPLERIAEEQTMIKCWKTMYNLLELYSTMPTTKTVQRQSLTPVSNLDTGILLRAGRRNNLFTGAAGMAGTSGPGGNIPQKPGAAAATPDIEQILLETEIPEPSKKKSKGVSFAKADTLKYEHTPLVVFGVAKIRKTKLMATLSGLKLEGEINGLQTSVQYKEKIRAPMKGVVEASVIGNMQETNIVLLEGKQIIFQHVKYQ